MALRVPEQQIANIKKLLELPDDKVNGFLDALAKAGPQFNVYDLSLGIADRSGLPHDLTLGIIQILTSLYLTRNWRESAEQFVDREVFEALKAAQTFSPEDIDVQWGKLRKFFVAALSLERSVGTAAKAGNVLTQHERIFAGARIVTDLRPIFHLDVTEKPDAAVIVHMLKITQRNHYGDRVDQYFALDSNDIAVMQAVFERAMKKEKTLRDVMKNSGMTVLDVKLFY
jgi:hypothetical protein